MCLFNIYYVHRYKPVSTIKKKKKVIATFFYLTTVFFLAITSLQSCNSDFLFSQNCMIQIHIYKLYKVRFAGYKLCNSEKKGKNCEI